MGQKANINSLHLSRTKDWNSVWYTNNKEYSKILVEDLIMLNYLKSCSLSSELTEVVKIRICRVSKDVIINLQLTTKLDTNSVSKLKEIVSNLNKIFPNFERVFIFSKVLTSNDLNIEPVYISKKISRLIENRVRFRSFLIKNLINQTFEACSGIKVLCKGRLNGADMASSDFITVGSIPFQTLKARIDYGFSVANTPKGLQSIKVWVYNK
jgi:small subunit ribosomal protein S3